MKIVAFAGSNSSTSINKELVKYTLKQFSNDEVILLDLNDFQAPLFSVDQEKKGQPEGVKRFIEAIANADVLVCSLAEHNQNYSVYFKNLLDWASRIERNFFQNKPMFLMSTSPGGFGGGNVLNVAKAGLPKFGADIKTIFSLPKFGENFDIEKGIVNTELKEVHQKAVKEFKEQISL